MAPTPSYSPLGEKNFSDWAKQVSAELTMLDLFWDVVVPDVETEGKSEGEIKSMVEEAQAKRTKSQMRKAKALLISRVEPSQFSLLDDDDPAICWQTLHRVHLAKGLSTIMVKRRSHRNATKDPKESMASFVSRVLKLETELKELGVKVDVIETILTLTSGLDSSYAPVIVSLDAIDPAKLTVATVTSRLLNEESRLLGEQGEDANRSDVKALAAKEKSGKDVKCGYCRKKGHRKEDCWKRERDEKKEKDDASDSDSSTHKRSRRGSRSRRHSRSRSRSRTRSHAMFTTERALSAIHEDHFSDHSM